MEKLDSSMFQGRVLGLVQGSDQGQIKPLGKTPLITSQGHQKEREKQKIRGERRRGQQRGEETERD